MRSLAVTNILGVLCLLFSFTITPTYAQMKWEALEVQEGFNVNSSVAFGSDFWVTTSNRLYRSEGGIDNWVSSENGLFTGKRPGNLQIFKGQDQVLYAYLPSEEKNFFIWNKNDKKWIYFVSLPKYLSNLSVSSSGDVYYTLGAFSGFLKRIDGNTGDVDDVVTLAQLGLNTSYAITGYKVLNDTTTLVVCEDFQNTVGFLKIDNRPARKILGSWKSLKFMATENSGFVFALHKDTLFQYDQVKEKLVVSSIENNADNTFFEDYIKLVDGENNTLWLGTRDKLYKSDDNGNTWVLWSENKQFQGKELPVFYEVFIANNKPYCWTSDCSHGLYSVGSDPGTTVFYKPRFKESYYNFVDGDLNGNVYTSFCGAPGIQVSSDNAKSWHTLTLNGSPVNSIPYFTSSGNVFVFVPFKDSCYVTNDGGNTWGGVKFPSIKSNIHAPINLNTSDGLLVAVSDRELFYSKDFGKTWQEQSGATLFSGTFLSFLNFDYVHNGIVLENKFNLFRIFNLKENKITEVKHNWGTLAKVFNATDSEMWLYNGYEKDSMYILKPDGKMVASKKLSSISPSDLDLNFFRASNGDIYALIDNTVFYSQNNGDTWKQVTAQSDLDEYVSLVRLWTNGKGNLFAFDSYSYRIFKTERTIVNTETLHHSLPVNIFPNPAQTSVTIDLSKSGLQQGEFILYDLAGKFIKSVMIRNSESSSFSLEGIQPGLYFIRIADETGKALYTSKLSVVE